MSDPTRYRVANNQAQLTLGGGILAVDPAGPLVMYDDYAELRMERIHDLNQIGGLQEENARLKADVNELADGLKLASEVGIKIADEVTRLKAEVERLNTGIQPEGSNDAVGRAVNVLLEKQKEIANLKAEVEAQAKRWAESEDLISHYKQQMDEVINNCQCSRLKAEVERLRKAGDDLAGMVGYHVPYEDQIELEKAWNAAKEGKPSV